jgi:hypothetical protein
MSALDDLTSPPSVAAIRTAIYSVLATTGVDTKPWKPGAVVRTIITAAAIVLAAFARLVSLITRSGFLTLAEGDWLTVAAKELRNVDRIDATFASGTITVNNSGGGVYPLDPGDLVVRNSVTKKTYTNTTAVTIGGLQQGVQVAIRATEVGSASSALAGEITEFETPLNGLSCANPVALVGLDAESDLELQQRCDEKLGALSPFGPADAFAFAAKEATRQDGVRIGVNRVQSQPDGKGNVYVWVASASGVVSGDASDPTTDLGAVADTIRKRAAPLGVTVIVQSAAPVTVPITYEAWCRKGDLTDADIADAISAELRQFFASPIENPIGGARMSTASGALYIDELKSVIGRARRDGDLVGVFRPRLISPAADLSISDGQIAVLGPVRATIHQVAA